MKNIKIDYISNTIIVTKGFYESAQNYGTEEQVTMRELQKEFPEMKISIRTSKERKSDCKGLTYDYMRKFIRKMDSVNIITFEDVIDHYKGLYKGAEAYKYVKAWFIENYPEYKEVFADASPKKIAA